MWKDIKYLIAYIAPLSVFFAIYQQGIWSYSAVYVAFVFIPILDVLSPQSIDNHPADMEEGRSKIVFFDLMLYLNIPILYLAIVYYFQTLSTGSFETYEIVGMTLSLGIIVSTIGINVAHELGHRTNKMEQNMSKTLLLTALYMHFFIEHNRGHHKNIATDEDPASARYGETVYAFWFRSVFGGYKNAWKLEADRLKKIGISFWSWKNQMLRFQIIQIAYLATIGFIWGLSMIPYAIAIAITGFLLLECVNYIEHYGLRRKKLESGRYEKVNQLHSWNSDHEVGRIFLYELTRHSDHHFRATRKYQILRHFDESPQLPHGYPASILMSLVPPLWFLVMNKKVKAIQVQ
ncbi:MAG: alkane 1-monooxygenase [Saprospiraceae bacterium]|jgi:alkane 1-monooxygenase|nr:alkane 1-monooxygenase [Saprospiraceae bacterium]